MPKEYSPQFLSNQMEGIKFSLESSQIGKEVLQILDNENIGGGPYMEGIIYSFPDHLKADFERLARPPYVDCLTDAVYIIELDLKLKCTDYETGIEHQIWFRHTADGVQIERRDRDCRSQ
jgi:hypothetical protein